MGEGDGVGIAGAESEQRSNGGRDRDTNDATGARMRGVGFMFVASREDRSRISSGHVPVRGVRHGWLAGSAALRRHESAVAEEERDDEEAAELPDSLPSLALHHHLPQTRSRGNRCKLHAAAFQRLAMSGCIAGGGPEVDRADLADAAAEAVYGAHQLGHQRIAALVVDALLPSASDAAAHVIFEDEQPCLAGGGDNR